MKKIFLIAYFLLNDFSLTAQNRFGNEWIDIRQRYLKCTITKSSIYRISYQDIGAVDASFLQVNPTNLQVFFRGQEIAIRVVGQQDGRFDEQDYIEFYGERNDGSQDSLLYRPQKRLHPYQTLFSDVAAYFLTVNSSHPGKRISESNLSAQGLSPAKFHFEETIQAYTSEYTFNNLKGLEPTLQQSYFEPGEGWSGNLLTADSVGVVSLKFTDRVTSDWPIRLEGMVNGRDNLFHRIEVYMDNEVKTRVALLNFTGFMSQTFQATIEPGTIHNERLTLRFNPEKIGTNQFSITYVKLSYPQAFDMANQATKLFHLLPNPHQTSLLSITNVPAGAIAYDITDKSNCRYIFMQVRNDQTQVVVGGTARSRDILLTNQLLKPSAIQQVRFRASFPKSTDYVIITHASLNESATAYAHYRSSAGGGGHQSFVVEADSLYDQFNYGERSPLALRRFADFMLANTSVKTLLLIGKATSYPYSIKDSPDDLVPTIGFPGSDILLTSGLANFPPNTPAIPTGRLSVTTNEQVLGYLAKIKQLEQSTPNGLWRKNIIHISGGKSKSEAESLQSTMARLGKLYTNGTLGGEVTAFHKNSPYDKVESINIAPLVNHGVSLITFFGHSGPSVTDVSFGFASLPQNGFRNQVYPLMIFNGCGVGEIFSKFNTLSTDWLLSPEKGASMVLAHSYYSYEQPTTRYLTNLYGTLFANPATLGMPLGQVQQQLNKNLEKEGVGPYDVAVLLQMILQGDPALSLYPLPHPDFAIDQKEMYLRASVAGSSIDHSDSLRIIIPLTNLGKFVSGQPVSLAVKKTTTFGSTNTRIQINSFHYRDTLVYTIPKDKTLQKIEVTIDPDQQIVELNRANNTGTLVIDWRQAGTSSSYPVKALPDIVTPVLNVLINGVVNENRAIVDVNPRIDIFLLDENPLSRDDSDLVEVYVVHCEACSPKKISQEALTVIPISANQLQITTTLHLEPGGTYQLLVFGKDAAGNRTQPPYLLDITVLAADKPTSFRIYPNPATTYTKFELTLHAQELPMDSRLLIYNSLGVQVFEERYSLHTGKNLLVWQGDGSGLYTYTLRLTWKNGRAEIWTGKVVRQD